jgi:hypothetical protein
MNKKLKQELVIRHSDKRPQTLNKGSHTDTQAVIDRKDCELSDDKLIVGRGFKSHHARICFYIYPLYASFR